MLFLSCLTVFSTLVGEVGSVPNNVGESLSYTFSFIEPSLHEAVLYSDFYTTVNIPGCMAIGKKAGEPALPVKFVKLVLPPKTKVKDINVVGTPVEVDTTNLNLMGKPVLPHQNPVPIGDKPPAQLAFDNDVYTSMVSYPFNICEEQLVGYCRGYAILSLGLNPVQYVPGAGKLFYYPEMSINIELEETGYVNQFFRDNWDDEEWVKNLVYNPEVAGFYDNGDLPTLDFGGGLCNSSDDYDYVIITTTYNGLDHWATNSTTPYNWTSLMDKHTTDDGLNCTLITIQEINACSDYWNATSLFNDTSAHIREFCKDAYQDWGTSYILIGGDDEWIPAREMDYAYESDVDSDIYWNHLDNTFNDDEDNKWGEEGDSGFDLYAEMYIGRITCDTPQDVSNWMNKSFYYADSVYADYLDSAAFYGGDSGWSCQGDDFIDFSAIKGTSGWLGPDPDIDGPYPGWLGFQYGFETWNANNPGMEYNLSVKWTAEPPNTGWQGGSESGAIAGFKNAINNNQVTLISAIAHANEYYSMDVHYTSWESDYHNTKPFFVHDYGCHCGDMDAADDGVIHSMLFHSDTELAFACVYNTCYGWGNAYSTNSSSSLQQKCFWDYFFDTTNNSGSTANWQLGKAMAFSKDTMAPTINWDQMYGTWRAVIQGCLLFGDPAQRIKPPTMLEHNVGVQTLDIDASNPVKPNEVIHVNATIYNSGENNETNVNVSFRINGSQENSTNISLFESQTTQQVSFNWTPSAGLYIVTINVTIPGVPEGSYSDNEKNQTVIVGVKNIDTSELFDTIQEAINDSNTLDGHSILVPSGTYYENIVIIKNISLLGIDRDTTIIESNGSADSVIQIQNMNSVNITRLTIKDGTYGVYIESSSNIAITDITVFNNTDIGIYLNSSQNISLANNEISNNTVGINVTNSSNNNTLTENEIINNSNGLTIDSGNNDNSIYHNNFNNSQNAIDNGSNNQWDNGNLDGFRLRGGNWWSNYSGVDNNNDGIGDTPYNISGINNSQDRYPLIEPWTGPLNGTIYVDDNNTAGPWDGTNTNPFQNIQDGIDDAINGDTIFVYNGTYQENIVMDKSVDLIGEDKNTTIIDANESGTVVYITADQVNITGFTIQNAGDFGLGSVDWANISVFASQNSTTDYCAGIHVSSSYNTINRNIISSSFCGILWLEELSNNNISYNTIENNYYDGITIGYSSNNTIVGNNITNNTYYGIDFGYSSDATIAGNTITNHTSYGGIQLYDSSDNAVFDNKINENYRGIHIRYSSNNNISVNNITNNSLGIYLYDSSNNNIFGNGITNNTLYGAYISLWSENNIIYHNNFINNTINAYDGESTNTWYNTTLLNGNYWGDYNGTDADDDGIGDIPYNISGDSNQDSYPLTGPWGQRPYQATLISPSEGATGVSTSPTLQVRVSDPNNDTMNVTFYASPGNTVIGTDTNVANGDIASVTWSSRSYSTSYNWYVVVNDSTYLTKSDTWSFTTESSGNGGNGYVPPPSGDTTAPTAPTNVSCTTPETDNTPSFTWNASTDTSGIAGYYVKIDEGEDTWIGNVLTWTSTSAIADGTHTFYVKAKDSSTNSNIGSYGSCSFIINTSSVGTPPISDANGPYTGLTYQNITFDGSGSYDSDGTIENYTWDFGDGNAGYGVTSIHSYNTSGVFTITLTVTDNDDLSHSNTTTANITLDSDGDGWSDEMEESYGTNVTDPNDSPLDIDGDGLPDEDSDDWRFTGDSDDDNDGIEDHIATP